MKVSVSLPEDDVAFVDSYARGNDMTRSAAMQRAVQLLRRDHLAADYEAANEEWLAGGEADLWDAVTDAGVR